MSSLVELVFTAVGTEGAARAVARVNESLGNMTRDLGRLAVGAMTVERAFTGVKEAFESGDMFNNLSLRVGESVRELVVLDTAFHNAGLGVEAIAQSANLLQRALGGVNEMGGHTDTAFKRIGTSIEELKPLSFSQQLKALSEGFAGLENQSDRANVAMQIFGRSGGQMLQLLGDPEGLEMAQQQAGRLGDRLQQDAKAFDAVGDRLHVVNLRFREMWVAVAEKLVPALQAVADVFSGSNFSAFGAFLGTTVPALFGIGIVSTLVKKLDTGVLEWATRAGEPAGQAFAGKFLAPITGGLVTFFKYALPALIGYEVGKGLGNAFNEWRSAAGRTARGGDADVLSASEQAGKIDSENARVAALQRIEELTKKIQMARDSEAGGILPSAEALAIYAQQLTTLRTMVAGLKSDWAQHQIELNLAAGSAERMAKAQIEAAAWLKSDAAKKLQDEIAKNIEERTPQETLLANQRAWLAIQERTVAITKAEVAAGRDTAVNQQLRWQATAAYEQALAKVADLEKNIARARLDAAKNELENRQMDLERRLTALGADLSQSEAEKWAERKRLLTEAVAAAQDYLDKTKAIREAATTDEAKRIGDANVRSAENQLTTKNSSLAGVGPNPDSIGAQLQFQTKAIRDSIRTVAEGIGDLWKNLGDSMRSSLGTAFYDMLARTKNLREAAGSVFLSIADSVAHSGAQMAADWIMNHVIMDNARKLFHAMGLIEETTATAGQVVIHATGEGAKTASTATGTAARSGFRLGETIFHGIQVAIRTAMHIAGEVAQTAITLTQSAIRIAATIAESLASVVKAAAGALAALASIPYVGPFLAVGAMIAILNAGKGMISSGGKKEGGFTTWASSDNTPVDVVHANEWVAPAWMTRDPQYRNIIDQLEAGRQGKSVPRFAAQVPGAPGFSFNAPDAPRASGGRENAARGAVDGISVTVGGAVGDAVRSVSSRRERPGNTYILLDRQDFARKMQEDSTGWFHDMSASYARRNA